MLAEDYSQSLPVEGLARPVVERESDGFEVIGGPAGQVGFLRGLLAEQSMVFSLLPGWPGLAGSQK